MDQSFLSGNSITDDMMSRCHLTSPHLYYSRTTFLLLAQFAVACFERLYRVHTSTHRHGSINVDGSSTSHPRENREGGVVLFFGWCELHHLDLYAFVRLQKARQPIDLLCLMGEHAGERCDAHQPKRDQSGSRQRSLPIPSVFDSNVRTRVDPKARPG